MENNTVKKEEQVLAITREAFDKKGAFNGYRSVLGRDDLREYLLDEKSTAYLPKSVVEEDMGYKQLIPYMAIVAGDEIFCYERSKKGDEERLHGETSIAIGGHVNSGDDPEDPFFALSNGAIREAKEEVGLELTQTEFWQSVYGFVNDDESPVGRVHLGVCCILRVPLEARKDILAQCEDTIINPRFVPITELENEEFNSQLEKWSLYFAMGYIDETSRNGKWHDEGFRERMALLSICASNLASSAVSMMMEDTPRSHMEAVQRVEKSAGEVNCMMSGVTQSGDVTEEGVKKSAKEFYSEITQHLKHQ